MMKKLFRICSLLMFPVIAHAGEVALGLDFESDIPNTKPAGPIGVLGGEEQVLVVEAAGVPDQLFGSDGGNVLSLLKGSDHEVMPRISWGFDAMLSGVVSFRAATPAVGAYGQPLLNVFLYRENLNAIGPSVYFADEQVFVRDGEAWKAFQGFWRNDTANEVRIEFFNDQTYRITVNGVSVPDESTRFRFHMGEVQEINRIQFAVASSTNFASQVFVDDVKIEH